MKITALTDIGLLRRMNQDTYALREAETRPNAIVAVCDGMGGAAAGNVASVVAVNHFMSVLEPQLESDEMPTVDMINQAVDAANDAVYQMALEDRELEGMGTTLVAAYICGNQVRIVNIGDSRAYLIRKKRIRQLTVDHSYVQELLRRGKITAEEAKYHPNRNLITKAVGVDQFVEADIYEGDLCEDDLLLLCSDGLCGIVNDEMILRIINESDDQEEAAIHLRHAAYDAGARDNLTILLFSEAGIMNDGGAENG